MTQENKDQVSQEPQAAAGNGENPARRFPGIADYFVFFGIFLVSQFAGMAAALIAGFKYPDLKLLKGADEAAAAAEQLSAAHFNAVTYFVAMSLTLAGFLFYRRRRRGPKVIGRFALKGLNPLFLIWGIVFMFATSVVLEPLLKMLPDVPDVYGRGVWAFVTLVVMAALFEEVICRGVLLESIRAKYGVINAWLVSSAIFGIVHLHPTVAVNAFVLGLIFGYIYIKSESLWTTIILHAANNGIAYWAMQKGYQNETLAEVIGSHALYVTAYVAASAVFVVSGYMMIRSLNRLKEREKINEAA